MGVGRSVALVPAAAAQTLVEAGADPAADTADAGADQQQHEDGEDDPHPEHGPALPVHRQGAQGRRGAGSLVAEGHGLQAHVVLHTNSSVEFVHESLELFLGVVDSIVDVILSVQQVSASGYKEVVNGNGKSKFVFNFCHGLVHKTPH